MSDISHIERYVNRFKPQGIIVDTNILILFLLGSCNSSLIEKSRLLNNNDKNYSKEDFALLKDIIQLFDEVIITPQIIAEISNLSITGNRAVYGTQLLKYLQTVIDFLKRNEERHHKIECLWDTKLEIIANFGFTDITMFELSRQEKIPILTDDVEFFNYAISQNTHTFSLEAIKNEQYKDIFQ
jgi:predicted nucleic acid-binding protein